MEKSSNRRRHNSVKGDDTILIERVYLSPLHRGLVSWRPVVDILARDSEVPVTACVALERALPQ